jgi:hypothetical protein
METPKKVMPNDWQRVLDKMDFYKRQNGFVDYNLLGELTFFDNNPKIDGVSAFYVTREEVLTYINKQD